MLTKLEDLAVCSGHVTDTGLQYLEGLRQLKGLRFLENHRKITDAGLRYLEGLKQLETLWLCDTTVTDAGLSRLKGLTRLGVLSFNSNKVTTKGINDLKRSLPDLDVCVGAVDDSDEERRSRTDARLLDP